MAVAIDEIAAMDRKFPLLRVMSQQRGESDRGATLSFNSAIIPNHASWASRDAFTHDIAKEFPRFFRAKV